MLDIKKQVPLASYSTMRLGGTAAYLAHAHSEADIKEAVDFAANKQLPLKVIGSGSNIIWPDAGYPGLVVINALQGVSINGTMLTAKSGVLWDAVVEQSVQAGLSGLELLSLIPGTTGAVPVQNVGAYGAEVRNVITSVRAYDKKQHEFIALGNADCNFGYRSSRFNTVDINRFIITAVTFSLQKQPIVPPFYAALQEYLNTTNSTDYSPNNIRKAVIAIRESKLPNPAIIPNAGSFFKNPIISANAFTALQQKFPTIVGWPHEGSIKVPAAWLLDCLGVKGMYDKQTGMAIHKNQALVLINKNAQSTADLLTFRDQLITQVKDKFGIELQQEPELVI